MPTLNRARLKDLYNNVFVFLGVLASRVASTRVLPSDFVPARTALEALPLTTEEAGVARNRLANAQRYAEAGEYGAARYELRLLVRGLDPQQEFGARQPRVERADAPVK